MTWSRHQFAAWLAAFSVLFAALAPAANAAALASGLASGLLSGGHAQIEQPVCHSAADPAQAPFKLPPGLQQGTQQNPDSEHGSNLSHCPLCLTQAFGFALLPEQQALVVPLPEPRTALRSSSGQLPRALRSWTPAEARAPPSPFPS